jgi:uncharacterized membrane protein YraQ (UPF0718 family)
VPVPGRVRPELHVYTIIIYGITAVLLLASAVADRQRTARALLRAWRVFAMILPEFLTVIIVTGLILAAVRPEAIVGLIGRESGPWGVLLAALVGSITLMPGFVAFPLAAMLLERGAGILQMAAFVSALMMVGAITFPMERRTFGFRAALTRNLLALAFSVVVAVVLALVLTALGGDGVMR